MTRRESASLGITGTLPPLFRMAAITGGKAVVELHLKRKVDANATDDNGRSALILAAENGHAEICRILLEAGASPGMRDDHGNDALSLAVNHRFKDVETVLRAYLPPLQKEDTGQSSSFSIESALIPESQILSDVRSEVSNGNEKTSIEGDEIDLSFWEEEKETPKPLNDASCLSDAREIRKQISRHLPIDADEDWSDVDIDLPEVFAFRRRGVSEEDVGWQSAIRSLLLSGLRYGWVTEGQVIETVPSDEENLDSPDTDHLIALRFILEDLGVQVEDLPAEFPFFLPEPNEENYPEESQFHDDLDDLVVDEAIAYFADLLSYSNDLLTQYVRDLGPKKILSRDEEIYLANEIYEGIKEALGTIPRSPAALSELINQLRKAEQGEIPIRSIISAGSNGAGDAASAQGESNFIDEDDDAEDSNELAYGTLDISSGSQITSDLIQKFASIRKIHDEMSGVKSIADREILADRLRDVLYELGASSNFILHLWSLVKSDNSNYQAREILDRGLNRVRVAKQVFAKCNLRLAFWLARKYRGLPFMDLVQEGNIGMLKAIDRFNPVHGAKFSTYATWWIRQSITRAIMNKQRLIRLPVHVSENIRKLDEAASSLSSRLGHNPTTEELALNLGIQESQVQTLQSAILEPISLVDIDDLEYSLNESTEDLDILSPEDILVNSSLKETLEEVIESLSAREADVIRLRFGFYDGKSYTLEEIGQMHDVSRERIRQIEAKALNKLAHPSRSNKLLIFMEATGRSGETES